MNVISYIGNSLKELKDHVTWPTMAALQSDLLKVFLLLTFFSISLGGLDIVVRFLLYKVFY